MERQTEQKEPEITEYLIGLRRRWVVVALVTLASVATAAAYVKTAAPVYRARALLVVEVSAMRTGLQSLSIAGLPSPASAVVTPTTDTHLQLIRSHQIRSEARRRVREAHGGQPPGALKAISFSRADFADVIEIVVDHTDPQSAADMANAIGEAYIGARKAQNEKQFDEALREVDRQIKESTAVLNDVAGRLIDYKEQTGIADVPVEMAAEIQTLESLRADYMDAEAAMKAAEAQAATAQARAASEDQWSEVSKTVTGNPRTVQLEQQIADLEVQRAGLLRTRSAESSDIVQLDARLTELRKQLNRVTEEVVSSVTENINPNYQAAMEQAAQAEAAVRANAAKVSALSGAMAEQQARLARYPVAERELAALTTEALAQEKLHMDLLHQKQQFKIGKATAFPLVHVGIQATPPAAPVAPRSRFILALAGLLGLIAGTVLGIALDRIDDTLWTIGEIESALGQRVLGAVPFVDEEPISPQPDGALVPHATREAYAHLRANIDFLGADSTVSCILVTSISPREGKTTTVAGLAASFADAGLSTAAVDCDLRRPSLGPLLGVGKEPGLTNTLVSGEKLELDEVLVATSVPRLTVCPSGPVPPSPIDVLASDACASRLQELSSKFQRVVLDSSPLVIGVDAMVLAREAVGVLLVVEPGVVRRRARRFIDGLLAAQPGTRILGILVNKSRRDTGGYYYYYRYSDDYYRRDGRDERPPRDPEVPRHERSRTQSGG